MKVYTLVLLLAIVVVSECKHTFLGTNVLRPMVYHHNVQYSSKIFKKRVENLFYALPAVPSNAGRSIQMKVYTLVLLLAIVVVSECKHTFLGTNVLRPMVYHHHMQYSSKIFRKRVENLYYALPAVPSNAGRFIQGIMAYDLTHSGATANVTQGGIGFNFVNLRMKSDRGSKLSYDVYIYA